MLETLPFHHRDPFDHFLIGQAMAEDLTILTADPHITQHAVGCVASEETGDAS